MQLQLFIVVWLVCSALGQEQSAEASAVRTQDGTFTGLLERRETVSGNEDDFYMYLGIPYAQPPVGARRWAPPEPLPSLPRVWHASQFGSPCPQPLLPGAGFSKDASEDCLTLNIFKPKPGKEPEQSRPVLVIVHGGAYKIGAAEFYSYKGLLSNIVSRDIIVVSINYRLGALGFLYDTPQKTAGNFGILDQLEALRWVQRNIGAFGGDPRRVTLYGQSAGAMSASLLSCMHEADGLFEQVVLQSGGAFVPAYFFVGDANNPIVQSSSETAAKLDCADATSYYECMRDRPWQDVLKAVSQCKQPIITVLNHVGNLLVYSASHQHRVTVLAPDAQLSTDSVSIRLTWGPLFNQSWMEQALEQRTPRPTLAGICHDEMAMFVLPHFAPNNTFEHFNRESLAQHIPGALGAFNQATNQKLQAAGVSNYLPRWLEQDGDSHLTWLNQTVKMYSDSLVAAPTLLDAMASFASGASVYLFSLDHAAAGLTAPYPLVPHAVDIGYMLGQFNGFEPDEDDWRLVEHYGRMLASFVRLGAPSLGAAAPEWPVVAGSRDGPLLMSLRPDPVVMPLTLAHPTVSFWLTDVLSEMVISSSRSAKDEL